MTKRKVYSVTVSPMNPRCWYVTLECGHSHWMTQKTKPKAGSLRACQPCHSGPGGAGR